MNRVSSIFSQLLQFLLAERSSLALRKVPIVALDDGPYIPLQFDSNQSSFHLGPRAPSGPCKLGYSHPREVVERRGLLVPVTPLTPPRDGEQVVLRDVRFRTVGDITCTCPVASLAASAGEIVIETLAAEVSERGATRMDDQTSDASMEKRKKDGYF